MKNQPESKRKYLDDLMEPITNKQWRELVKKGHKCNENCTHTPESKKEFEDEVDKRFVFEKADPIYPHLILFRVNSDKTRSIATPENIKQFIRSEKKKSFLLGREAENPINYEIGFQDGKELAMENMQNYADKAYTQAKEEMRKDIVKIIEDEDEKWSKEVDDRVAAYGIDVFAQTIIDKISKYENPQKD